jgi:hypothetical protein
MEPARCPYCVEEDAFKVMSLVDLSLVCGKCGHRIALDRPTFICSCLNCRHLDRSLAKAN